MFFFIFSICFFIGSTNCATYLQNRKNDFKDIFTAGVETPGYGIGFRIGPLAGGFVFQGGETAPGKRDLGKGYGLRGGYFGSYRSQQLIFGILGSDTFFPLGVETQATETEESSEEISPEVAEELKNLQDSKTPGDKVPEFLNERYNIKSQKLRYLSFYNIPVAERRKRKKEEFYRRFIEEQSFDRNDPAIQNALQALNKKKDGYPKSFLYQIEIYLGLYAGIRLGFNPAELLDFLVGIAGLDLLEDDTAD
ncbi:LIC13411 family adhesin [Leptospira kmetyi]|uniref:LIC13411 family adhesin n=1 Tax=Leptospira kmetyi TaxID=408139 RepID=UPI003CCFE016